MRSAILLLTVTAAVVAQVHEVCGSCHEMAAAQFKNHPHAAKNVSCDACHGPSQSHIDTGGNGAPDKVPKAGDQGALCGACHEAARKGWEASKHGQGVASNAAKSPACTGCHTAHTVREPAAIEKQCRRCHEQLPAACQKEPAAKTAKLSCGNCHASHSLARQ